MCAYTEGTSPSSLRPFDVYDNNLLLSPGLDMEMISEFKLCCLKLGLKHLSDAVACLVSTAAHSLLLLFFFFFKV